MATVLQVVLFVQNSSKHRKSNNGSPFQFRHKFPRTPKLQWLWGCRPKHAKPSWDAVMFAAEERSHPAMIVNLSQYKCYIKLIYNTWHKYGICTTQSLEATCQVSMLERGFSINQWHPKREATRNNKATSGCRGTWNFSVAFPPIKNSLSFKLYPPWRPIQHIFIYIPKFFQKHLKSLKRNPPPPSPPPGGGGGVPFWWFLGVLMWVAWGMIPDFAAEHQCCKVARLTIKFANRT